MNRRTCKSRNCALLCIATAVLGCSSPAGYKPTVAGGNADRGRAAVVAFECGACHRMPGIPGARGNVGPPLVDFERQVYVAGRYPNVPRWLIAWIHDPPSLDPNTAMPNMGVTEAQARDIAAYLYR